MIQNFKYEALKITEYENTFHSVESFEPNFILDQVRISRRNKFLFASLLLM